SAEVFEYLQHAEDYGIKVGSVRPMFDKVVSRSRSVADKMSKGIGFLFRKNKIDTLEGFGKVTRDQKVEVTAEDGKKTTYAAQHIIVATGARSRELPHMPIDGKKIIGYRGALALAKQPKSMIVVGSGAIGSEFAYFYAAMGTEVTLIEYVDRIVPAEDEEVSQALARSFKKRGIKVMTSSEVTAVDTKGRGVTATVKTKKGEVKVEADMLLSAVGIVPNTENIGLEALGIKTNRGQVVVDDYYRTNVPNIYAIGDIVHGPALAHVASAEGIICVEKIKGMEHLDALDYNNIPGCTYCQPEIASVGYTEKKAKEAGYEIKVGKFPFSASGKATAAGKTEGFVKVIFDAKYGEWLGAHFIGANVTEMIAEVVAARKLETTGHEMIKTVHPHPTMSEAVMEACAAAYDEVIHL
ncbi:MAG: dihydrolipoyl dehydrogenase, partial [Bacteroidota bacterium]